MSVLPEIVRKILQTLQGGTEQEISIVKSSYSEIGSSCNVVVKSQQEEETSLYVKFLDFRYRFSAESLVYFNNETIFYGDILTLFSKVLNHSKGKPFQELSFAPKCYEVGRLPQHVEPFIIMEDLLAKGYTPLEEKELTLEEARMVVEQLGNFHALSFAARENFPEEFDEVAGRLTEVLFSEETRFVSGRFLIHAIHDALKLAKQSFPPESVYVEKLAHYTLNVFDNMVEMLRGRPEDYLYRVITHGDLWPNNVICNRDEEDSTVAFLDFHACRLSSPVHDLQLLLLVGLDASTRRRHGADLIRTYHAALCNRLEEIGIDPIRTFPYKDLDRQLRTQSRFAMGVALAGLPLFLAEETASKTAASKARNVDELFKVLRDNKSTKCKCKMLEIVVDMVDQGYL